MEASCEGGQDPEGAVAPYMDGTLWGPPCGPPGSQYFVPAWTPPPVVSTDLMGLQTYATFVLRTVPRRIPPHSSALCGKGSILVH